MVNFTDKKLYLKGTCQVNVTDPCDGRVLFSSDKFQTANITTSVSPGEIRAGMGNGIATMIPSDAAVNVEFNAADFNLWAKSAQVGATLSYGAPAHTCVTVEAGDDGSIQIDPANGEPVAGLGFPAPFAYVQEVGVAGTRATTGTPYPISAIGLVSYTGESGKEYRVEYFSRRAEAQIAVINSMFDSKVVHFTAQMPVFRNDTCSSHEGSRVGWFYIVVPRMKLGGNGGIVGDQTTPDTTSLSGQAVAYDDYDISTCGSCGGSVLAYYSYVPDNGAESVVGIAIVGGYLEVNEGTTVQAPVRLVMENGELVAPESYQTGFTYTPVNPPTGTTVSESGEITAGTEAGDFELIITYDNAGTLLTTSVFVSVQAISVVGIYINGGSITVQEGTTEQIVTEIEMSDGSVITPTDFETGFTYTADSLPDGTSISADGVITGGGVPGTFNVTVSYISGGQTFTDTATVIINAELKPIDYTSIYLITVPAGQRIQGNINVGTRSYTIDWGDGERVTANYTAGQSVNHTYEDAGDYTIMVKDNQATPTSIGSLTSFYPRDIVNEVLIDTNNNGIGWDGYTNMEIFAYGQHMMSPKWGDISGNPALKTVSYMNPGSIDFNLSTVKNCAALEEVHVMASSMRISRNVSANGWFDGCPNLKVFDISNLTSVPTLSVNPWTGFPTTAEVRVPAALLNNFKTATNWSIRANQFVGV